MYVKQSEEEEENSNKVRITILNKTDG